MSENKKGSMYSFFETGEGEQEAIKKATDLNSWDSLIAYTKDQLATDSLGWYPVEEWRESARVALVSNIIGQYMQRLANSEKKTETAREPKYKEFIKSFSSYYEKAKKSLLADLQEKETEPQYIGAVKVSEHIRTVDKISSLTYKTQPTETNAIKVFTQAIAMERKGSNTKVTTYVTVNYEGLDKAKVDGVKWLEPFDWEVLNAVHSLFKAGNSFITINQIYRTMTGTTGEKPAPAGLANQINNSLTKLMYTQLGIDATEEAKAFGYAVYKYDSSFIVGQRGEAKLNGTLTTGVFIHALGLLGYADMKNQIARVPIQVLDTPLRKDATSLSLQGYLIKRIEGIKSGLANKILLETLLDDLNIIKKQDIKGRALTPSEKMQRKRVVENITKLLEYWREPTEAENETEHISYIKSFAIEGKNPIKAFTINY